MAQLLTTGTAFLAFRPSRAPIVVERIDPRRALAVLIATGYSAEVARELAFAGDLTPESGVRHGQRIKKNGVALLVSDGRTRGERVAERRV